MQSGFFDSLPFLFRNEFLVSLSGDGGDKRDRTADLLNAIQALSQLSYTPRCGKEHLFSFVEGCVTASTGLTGEGD